MDPDDVSPPPDARAPASAPIARPCRVLKGATCHNPGCIDEPDGWTCLAFEPGGNQLVSIPFDARTVSPPPTDTPAPGSKMDRIARVLAPTTVHVLDLGGPDDAPIKTSCCGRTERELPVGDILAASKHAAAQPGRHPCTGRGLTAETVREVDVDGSSAADRWWRRFLKALGR